MNFKNLNCPECRRYLSVHEKTNPKKHLSKKHPSARPRDIGRARLSSREMKDDYHIRGELFIVYPTRTAHLYCTLGSSRRDKYTRTRYTYSRCIYIYIIYYQVCARLTLANASVAGVGAIFTSIGTTAVVHHLSREKRTRKENNNAFCSEIVRHDYVNILLINRRRVLNGARVLNGGACLKTATSRSCKTKRIFTIVDKENHIRFSDEPP